MTKNIYQRINAVMKEVEYVQKDATVQTYKAVSHDMVTAVIRPHLVKQGIVVQLEQLRSEILVKRNVKDGEKMHLYSGDYAVHLVNMDSPEDRVSVTINAHANDNGDKAPGKAASYATKVALLKIFSLETGENDEQRFADPYSPEQFEAYHELIETEKAYEFYMFVTTLSHETSTGLVNSFPDGKKSQGKKLAAKLEAEGAALFKGVVEDLQHRLAMQDPSATEITDEMTRVEKGLLVSRLSPFEIKQLKSMKEAAA